MKLDHSLSFRKIIIPWYDTDAACYATIAFLLPVFVFSLLGIDEARSLPSPAAFIWVPLLLSVLSALVLVTVIARLIRRHPPSSG